MTDLWNGTKSTETDAREWAREFSKFCAGKADTSFEQVTEWFAGAIEAGANAAGTPLKTIEAMQAEVLKNNAEKGWLDEPYSFGDCMANLAAEVSEAWEAWRQFGLEDVTGPQLKHQSWCSNSTSDDSGCCGGGDLPKPEGVGSEFADIFIRLLDDCQRYGIDLRAEYERKMAFNRTRPYRHGGKRA